jgi:hypothetical protein
MKRRVIRDATGTLNARVSLILCVVELLLLIRYSCTERARGDYIGR